MKRIVLSLLLLLAMMPTAQASKAYAAEVPQHYYQQHAQPAQVAVTDPNRYYYQGQQPQPQQAAPAAYAQPQAAPAAERKIDIMQLNSF